MARVTTSSRSSSRRTPEPAPKKRLGRPPGSKNIVPAASKAKAAPASAKRVVRKTAAPAAPKLNKAELEAHVVKLERTVVRLRKQNAELKQAARETTPEPTPAPAPEPTPERKPKRSAAPKAARASKKAAQPAPDLDEPSDDLTED